MLVYIFAVLAAAANAASSVLQRKADRDQPAGDNLSFRLVLDLLSRPAFFFGIAGLTAGFLLQAAALGSGPLAVVEPILIVELPLTLLLGSVVFGKRLGAREWSATAAITVGLVVLLYGLSPGGGGAGIAVYVWVIGIGVNAAVIAALVIAARRGSPGRRSALLGVATGSGFGLTAALIKAVTDAFASDGFVSIFTTWQTYLMIVAGAASVFLLQSALNAGSLVAAQPGFTGADPVVSILWGVLAFGEQVRAGAFILLALAGAASVGWGIWHLSKSSFVTDDEDSADSTAGDTADGGQPATAEPHAGESAGTAE
jgi:drug/metabolite transporter (DMT)-like permease